MILSIEDLSIVRIAASCWSLERDVQSLTVKGMGGIRRESKMGDLFNLSLTLQICVDVHGVQVVLNDWYVFRNPRASCAKGYVCRSFNNVSVTN